MSGLFSGRMHWWRMENYYMTRRSSKGNRLANSSVSVTNLSAVYILVVAGKTFWYGSNKNVNHDKYCEPFPCVLLGKSFLRNRLFKGLDSWPPTSFCVSWNWRTYIQTWPYGVYFPCEYLFRISCLFFLLFSSLVCRHESPEGLTMNYQTSQWRI